MIFLVHRLATKEYVKALRQYERQSVSISERFVEATHRALDLIEQNPKWWPRFDERRRWIKIKKFPYIIYFEVADAAIKILAVAHEKRRPGYWKRRSMD